MGESICVGSPPPTTPHTRKDVVRVTTAETSQFVIISAAVWGQWTHWDGRRTEECLKDKKVHCPGCNPPKPSKWLGYVHVAAGKWDGFLELTATAVNLLEEQAGKGANLRGLVVRIKRTKGGPRGRFLIEVLDRRVPEDELPQGQDPYETLRFLWSCKRPGSSPYGK